MATMSRATAATRTTRATRRVCRFTYADNAPGYIGIPITRDQPRVTLSVVFVPAVTVFNEVRCRFAVVKSVSVLCGNLSRARLSSRGIPRSWPLKLWIDHVPRRCRTYQNRSVCEFWSKNVRQATRITREIPLELSGLDVPVRCRPGFSLKNCRITLFFNYFLRLFRK